MSLTKRRSTEALPLPVEPAEITWSREGIDVVYTVDREWWAERIAVRAKNYG